MVEKRIIPHKIVRNFPVRTFFLLLFCCGVFFAKAQPVSGPNEVDSKNRKQGHWEKFHSTTGKPAYKATFKDDQPVGIMQRFYEDGTLQVEVDYGTGKSGRAKLFYPDGESVMAEGKYLGQERDSVWRFYSPEGALTSEEQYVNGKKNGLSRVYFADGSIAEKINYKDDVPNGDWEQFYLNGQPKLKANVVNGIQYEGKYTMYYDDGKKQIEGSYVNGKKESSWYEFNPDGSIKVIYVYRNGNVVEEHFQNGTFEKYYSNDILRSVHNYKNGKKHGPFKEYFAQGEWRTEEGKDEFGNRFPVQRLYGTQLQREGKYLDGELHGEVINYNSTGQVISREKFDKGVPVR